MARPAQTDGTVQVTTAAMERFTCRMSACEDSCCRDWAVSLDEAGAVGSDRRVHLTVLEGHSPRLTHIEMDPSGACSMLDERNLCRVQTVFGEGALPTTCSVFPRTSLAVEGRLEVTGTLACPELARLYLLGSEDIDLRAATRPLLQRRYVGKTVERGAARFAVVRQALLSVFRLPEYPVSSRLLFAADLATRLQPQLDRSEELSEIAASSPEILDGLHAGLVDSPASGEALCLLLVPLLLERKRLPHGPRYARLLQEVFSSIQSEALGGGGPARPEDTVTPAQIWTVYRRRRDAFDARLPERTAAVFGRYCEHFLLRHPHTDSGTLLEHLFKLGLHLAAIRLLVCGHPDVAARLDAPRDPALDESLLERLVVHATQTFTKTINHQVHFLEQVFRSIETAGGFTMSKMVMLAKFV